MLRSYAVLRFVPMSATTFPMVPMRKSYPFLCFPMLFPKFLMLFSVFLRSFPMFPLTSYGLACSAFGVHTVAREKDVAFEADFFPIKEKNVKGSEGRGRRERVA